MRSSNLRLLRILFFVAMILAALEDLYGRVRYSADAINYLDMVRAIHAGNWKLALSPYWGFGYPLLISAITPFLPHTPAGEWFAVHVLNWMIFLAAFLSFYWLVQSAARTTQLQWIVASEKTERFLLFGAFTIFLSIELSMDNVSRVGPDMLVTTLFFAAAALLIKLGSQPKGSLAVALGVVLGAGYVVKTIFLPMTFVFAITAALMLRKKGRSAPSLLLMLSAFALCAAPYIAGLSWSAGHLTLGESGSLNYAWNVNKLEPGGLWQGQPPGYGTPVHPAKMISAAPHIYVFDGPFPVTFGPFFNSPYYYQGYKSHFNLKALIHETGGNVLRLIRVLRVEFVIYALILCWFLSPKPKPSLSNVVSLWPLVFISIAGTAAYLLIFVEARYVAFFVAALMMTALFYVTAQIAVAERTLRGSSRSSLLHCILIAGCVACLCVTQRDADRNVFGHMRNNHVFSNDEQWKAGLYLEQTGLKAGDKVAVINDLVSATRSTWAYMDHLQIVGILGGSLLESYTGDFDAYWHAAPVDRERMLAPFREAGARAVVAGSKPTDADADGWEPIPGTAFWVYRF